MRTCLLLLTILTVSFANGQKAPVRYVPIDSVTVIPFGLAVKLDFKGKTLNNGQVPTAYPWLKTAKRTGIGWTGDTLYLTINKEKIEFLEWKGLGVDYYFFPAERLESTNYKKNHTLTIHSSEIKEVTSDSILFRLNIQLSKKKTSGKWTQIYSRKQDLWIKRKDLDGVLINELDLE